MSEQPDPHTKDPTVVEAKPLAVKDMAVAAHQIDTLLAAAVDKDLDVEKLAKLIELKNQQDDRQAAREFIAAKAAFLDECDSVPKSKTVDYASKAGGRVNYSYAPLEAIQQTIRAPLRTHGFTYQWDEERINGGGMRLLCTLSHSSGHRETVKAEGPMASAATGMDPLKVVSSTRTVLKRESLVNVLGLTRCDPPDNDGTLPPDGSGTITEDQANELNDMLIEAQSIPATFMGIYGIRKLGDLPSTCWEAATAMLNKRIDEAKKP